MYFEKYDHYNEGKRKQHNIMCLVGNGFDIAAIQEINKDESVKNLGLGPYVKSRYPDFFDYLQFSKIIDENENSVYREMVARSKQKKKPDDWCDFESIVDDMVFGNSGSTSITESEIKKIEEDLRNLQYAFSAFLNRLLPSEKIVKHDELVRKEKLYRQCLRYFIGDVDDEDPGNEIRFPGNVTHDNLLNFLFVDFNYTMLLDSYINCDKESFDVKLYQKGHNFYFYPNPRGKIKYLNDKLNDGTGASGAKEGYSRYVRILTHVVHPHGIKDAPGSMLFGTENTDWDQNNNKDIRYRFIKSEWARDEEKYGSDFDNTRLFIIFGMSISKTDGWWMTRIYRRLLDGEKNQMDESDKPELIIYNFEPNGLDRQKLIDKFIKACIYLKPSEKKKPKKDSVIKHIHIATFNGENNSFLGYYDQGIKPSP